MNAQLRQVLAAVLIGLGLLWLLGTLGLVSGAVLSALLAFWPLLLIGLGLDLLWRQRRLLGLPFTLLALAVIALLSLWPGAGRGSLQTFTEAIGVAQSAVVNLSLGSAPTELRALETTDTLIKARLRDRGQIRFDVSGNETKRVSLSRRSRPTFGLDPQRRWDIGLSPVLPLELTVNGGSGSSELDLRALNLRSLRLEPGSGSSRVTLPAEHGRSEVSLDGGSGRNELLAPAGADLVLRAETGSGATSIRVEPGGYLMLELDAGSGNVELDLPESANIQLEVLDGGSGRLNLPEALRRVAGDGEEGRWQTEGFEPGAGQVILTVRERGSGAITLR